MSFPVSPSGLGWPGSRTPALCCLGGCNYHGAGVPDPCHPEAVDGHHPGICYEPIRNKPCPTLLSPPLVLGARGQVLRPPGLRPTRADHGSVVPDPCHPEAVDGHHPGICYEPNRNRLCSTFLFRSLVLGGRGPVLRPPGCEPCARIMGSGVPEPYHPEAFDCHHPGIPYDP